jgi:hypothetical protein
MAMARDRGDRLEERLASAAAARAKLETELAVPQKGGEPKRASGTNWFDMLRNDPTVQSRFLAYQRSGFIMTYGPLFGQLGLSPEQISKCEDLLAKREEDRMDLNSTVEEKGLSYGDPAVQAIRKQQDSDFETAEKTLLGDDGFSQLATYEQTIPARMAIAGISGAATVDGIPLASDQMQKLTDLVLQTAQSNYGNWSGDADGSLWGAIDAKAAAFLTPAQSDLMKSGEFLGPQGYGTRYQGRLNALITLGFQSDANAANGAVANSSTGSGSGGVR